MKRWKNDLRGKRFGKWVAIRRTHYYRSERSQKGTSYWLCRCDCGTCKTVSRRNLIKGASLSCGCMFKNPGTHRMRHTPTYMSWNAMKVRCLNPRQKSWEHYGGRGIQVCKKWLKSFEAFVSDMGNRPPGMTLDRKNVNGNYHKKNCRWATRAQQVQNRR